MITKKRRILKLWRQLRQQPISIQTQSQKLSDQDDPDPPAPTPTPDPDPPTPTPQPEQQWNLQQTDTSPTSTASNVTIQGGNKLSFSFPRYSQIIYPGQTVRICTGWQVSQMPTDTMMHIMPHPALLNYNVVSGPQIYHASNIGQQVVQVVLNNSDNPVQFMYKAETQKSCLRLFSLDRNLQLTDQQPLQFDIGNFFTGLLGAASHIIPALL